MGRQILIHSATRKSHSVLLIRDSCYRLSFYVEEWTIWRLAGKGGQKGNWRRMSLEPEGQGFAEQVRVRSQRRWALTL